MPGSYPARPGWSPGLASPAQLTFCPWCGSAVDPGRNIVVKPYARDVGRTLMYCSDTGCAFSAREAPAEGIPALTVDEEIYRRLPALVIATVDKFAQMAWNGATQMLFGQVDGWCARHGFTSPTVEDATRHPGTATLSAVTRKDHVPLRPPDLIIQDELHLISGPLGTLVGLYETAVDELCTWQVGGRRVRPKVIASTATIRRAPEQVHKLFLRDVAVFPPHGVDVADNFFARERCADDRPEQWYGRRYLGICAPGRRLKAAMIRVYVALLAAAQKLHDEHGLTSDPWMTLVGYFNSMKELGGMRRLVEDDVRSRLRDTDDRGLARRPPPHLEELTSRKHSGDIPELLDLMEVPFDPVKERERKRALKARRKTKLRRPLDVLLATNMISVGVDVKRLGLMVVAGQPKTTAEYIQASSRVGRSAPGLVVTVFNWARPRDLSHYERFIHYHATFYQHVEALSVTPFATGAVDRGLTALLVSLIRDASPDLNDNLGAQRLVRDHPLASAAVRQVRRRAELVQADTQIGEHIERMLQKRLDSWISIKEQDVGTDLGFRRVKRGSAGRVRALLSRPGGGGWGLFTCPNSLREVEPTVALLLQDGGLDETGPAAEGGPW